MKRIIIGSRGSTLALWQSNWVVERLKHIHFDTEFLIRKITTKGDVVRDRPLSQVGDKGLFVKEIETALLAGEIDLAVHSLKDMPTEQPQGLIIGAVTARADPRDALVSRLGLPLAELPQGARLGTSSLRRAAQLRALRPDFQIVDLRGNVDTRLHKAESDAYDGVILAVAGLTRLGRAGRITERLPIETMLPAVGQGALCIEVRADDTVTREIIASLTDGPTWWATTAERAFLRRLEGGCQVPIAAHAIVRGEELTLYGLVASVDGRQVIRGEKRGAERNAEAVGVALAEELLERGAAQLLAVS